MILHGAEGTEYRTHFFYADIEHEQFGLRRLAGCHLHTGACIRVNDSPCQAEGGEGTTIFNPHDKEYTKAKGRAYALARAMKGLGLAREQRTLLWADYVRIVGVPVKGGA